MHDLNAINVPIVFDVKNLESVKDAGTAVKGLQDDVKTLRELNKSVTLEAHKEEYDALINIAENNINDLMRLRRNVDNADTEEDRGRAISQYQTAKSRAVTSIKSINSELGGIMHMLLDFTQEQAKVFTDGIRNVRPQIAEAFNETAKMMATTGTKGSEQIINSFKKSAQFKKLWQPLKTANPEVFSDEIAEQFLRNSISSMVSKRYINEYVGWNNQQKAMPSTFRGRLPALFQNLPLIKNPTREKFNENAELLTEEEAKKMQRFLKKMPFLAEEAEKAGLARRENGQYFFNPRATREHVNSFAGHLTSLFEVGERGGKHNGIESLEGPLTEQQRKALLTKHNQSIDNAEYGARFLSNNYGSWLAPKYTSQPKAKKDSTWINMGDYYAPSRQRSMEFYEIGTSDIAKNGNIAIQSDSNGRGSAGFYEMKYNMLADKIQNMPARLKKRLGVKNFEHNGFGDSMMFLRVPVEELEDPSTTPERKEEIVQDLYRAIKSQPKFNSSEYVVAGNTGTHIALIKKGIRDAIENGDAATGYKADPNFFYNGETRREFGQNAHDAFRAYEYSSKIFTDVEPTSRVYGTNLKHANVVVGNMKALTGLDGQNIGSRAFFPETFQSRMQRDKSTTQVIDFDKYFYNKDAPYHNLVNENGDIVIPNGGINGGDLVVPKGTALLMDWSNIKTKYPLQGLSQQDVNDRMTETLRRDGYFVKQSAADYNTRARFISAQEASTMELRPEVREYFRQVAMQRLAELDDPDAAKRMLFSGNDWLSQIVNNDDSALSQSLLDSRIADEKEYIYSNLGQGRLMIPEGSAEYAMLSAWFPDVLNSLIGEENLTENQKYLSLGNNAIAFLKSQAEKIQMYRNPSTIEGNIEAANEARDEYFRAVAEFLGVNENDAKQLFVNPKQNILERMQSADLDSDTAFATLKEKNPVFAQMMGYIMADTAQRWADVTNGEGYTEKEFEEIQAQQTKQMDVTGRNFGLGGDNIEYLRWFVNKFGKVGGMGAANAVSTYASQYPLTPYVKRAIMASNPHYDKNSIYLQKDSAYWDMTPEEWKVIGGGAPFSQVYRWTKDAFRPLSQEEADEYAARGEPVPNTIFDSEKFWNRKIDKVNFTSIHDAHGLQAAYSSWSAARRRPKEFAKYGHPDGATWNEVFSSGGYQFGNQIYDPDSAVGQYLDEMRTWKAKKANQEFLYTEDELADRWVQMAENANYQIWGEVLKEGYSGREAENEVERRFNAIGGHVAKHHKDFGLTRSNLAKSDTLMAEAVQLGNIFGTDKLFAGAGAVIPEALSPTIDYEKEKEAAQKELEAANAIKEEQKRLAKEKLAQIEKEKEAQKQNAVIQKEEVKQQKEEQKIIDTSKEVNTEKTEASSSAAHVPKYQAKKGDHAFLGTAPVTRKDVVEGNVIPGDHKTDIAPGVNKPKRTEQAEPEPQTPEYKAAVERANAAEKKLATLEMQHEFDSLYANIEDYALKYHSETNALGRKAADTPFAQSYIAKQFGLGYSQIERVNEFYRNNADESGTVQGLDIVKKGKMDAVVAKIKSDIYDNIINESEVIGNQLEETFKKDIAKQEGVSKQKQLLDQRKEEINQYKEWESAFRDLAKQEKTPASVAQKLRNQADKVAERAKKREEDYLQVQSNFIKENELSGQQAYENLQMKFGLRNKNSLDVRVASRKQDIQTLRDKINQQHDEGLYNDEAYNKISSQLDDLEKKTSKVSIATQDMLNRSGRIIGNVAQRLGRQLFQKALQETKRFIKEFDSSMNEIQAITLKSNSEMQGIRSQTINKALGLRTSVSNVANVEAALYRQGLSDQEVSARTESIIKFATVTKLNVQEATKIITTALQNDLVKSANEAMDALVALGDSAATTAAEIGKGMQKAAASAKVAGVSYAELTALLTIGTSDTQLSGTQVGTALQTVFSRMRRMSVSGWTADQNGEKTTASDAEAALKSVGIDLWDDKSIGKMRTAYDVLLDLSKVWQNLSDAQKNIVMNAMAGTRQTNVFSTLMEGMSEDNGATLEKYLGLAEGSEGITQSKYEIAMQSLSAAMDELKSSWDAVVESFTNSGLITGVLDSVSDFLQMIANAGSIGQGFSVIVGGITGITVALAALSSTNPILKALSTVLGLVAGFTAAGGIAGIANLFVGKSEEEKFNDYKNELLEKNKEAQNIRDTSYADKEKTINEVKRLGKAYDQLKESQDSVAKAQAENNLVKGLYDLQNAFPEVSNAILQAIKDLSNWEDAVNSADKVGQKYLKNNTSQTVLEAVSYQGETSQKSYEYLLNQNAFTATRTANLQKSVSEWLKDTYFPTLVDVMASVSADLDAGGASTTKGYNDLAEWQKTQDYYGTITGEEFVRKFNTQDALSASDESKRRQALISLYSEDSDFKDYIDNFFSTNKVSIALRNNKMDSITDKEAEDFWQNAMTRLYNPETQEQFEIAKRQIDYSFAQSMVEDFPIENLASDTYDTEFITKTLKNFILKSITNSETGEILSDYLTDEGLLDTSKITPLISSIFNGWLTSSSPDKYIENFANENAPDEAYSYFLGYGKNRQRFTSMEAAMQAVAASDEYGYEDIIDNSGNSAYQSSQKAIEAMLLSRNSDKSAQNLVKAIRLITSEEINSLDKLKEAYDKEGLGQEIANVLSSNAELLGAYVATSSGAMSYDDFKKAASEMGAGRSNRADLVSNLFDYLQSGLISVEDFRTSANYTALYETFKNIVGDSADAVLNAIEDGVSDPSALKELNKALISQRIKETMQFDKHYQEALEYATIMLEGTSAEKQQYKSTQQNSIQELNNYNAAVGRYISGNATKEDISVISSRGLFRETELRNKMGDKDFAQQVRNSTDILYEEQGAARTAQLNALLGAAGLTFDEYKNGLNEIITAPASLEEALESYQQNKDRIYESQESYIQNYRNKHTVTAPRKNFVNAEILQQIDALLADTNYELADDGTLRLKKGAEERLTSRAVLQDSTEDIVQRRRLGYIRDALEKGLSPSIYMSDAEYAKVLSNDETLRNLTKAGAGSSVITSYINRQLNGQKGSFSDNYGWVAEKLFKTSDWSDISNWDIDWVRSYYQAVQGTATGNFINEMISQMPDAENLQKYISGESAQLPENYASEFVKWFNTEALKGIVNAEQIAANQTVLQTGSTFERMGLLSQFEQQQQEAKNAQYYLTNRNYESAGILASYLGISEEKARTSTDKDLQNALNDKVKQMIIDQARSYGADLEGISPETSSLADVKNALIASLDNVDEKSKDYIRSLIRLFDGAGQLLGEKTAPTLTDLYESARGQLDKNAYENQGLMYIRDNIDEFYKRAQRGVSPIAAIQSASGWNEDWNESVFNNSGIVAALSMYANGTLSNAELSDFINAQIMGSGKNGAYYDMLSSAVFGNGYQNGQFTSVQALKEGYNKALQSGNGDILEWYKELENELGTVFQDAVNGSEEALKELNKQIDKKKAEDITKYTKATGSMASALSKLKRGGKEAAEGTAVIRKNMENLQDQMTAVGKASGKSGKQFDSKTLDFIDQIFPDLSAEDIKSMTKDQLSDILDSAPEYINEVFTDTIQSIVDQAMEDAQSIANEKNLNLDLSAITVDANGSPDFSGLDSEIQAILEKVWALLEQLSGDLGSVEIDTEALADNAFKVVGKVNKNAKGSYHGGKSGGGGGKSETDKLLERQKQRTAEYEHQSKMLEIQEKFYDFVNDYSGHAGNINEQISAQESLRSAYAQNLSELRAQLGAVEQGSDDYNKLADAIRSAEEAMASIGNTINELNAKKIQIVATKQENEDKPLSHQLSMLQKYADRYQTTGQFESYANIMEKTIEETKNQITQNNGQIREWENLLTTYEENSDSWIEVRDKIWALREENAELENQVASDTISLQEAKISQIAQDLQNTTLGAQHENNVLDTFGQIYQSVNNQEGYRRVLADTNENNQRLKEQTDAAIEQIKKEIDEMEATDPARQTAIQTLYELEETSAQYEASMLQNRQAIEESLINELTQGHGDATSVLEHEMKLLSEAEKAFTRDDDFVNYENILQEEARNAALRLEEQERALKDYLELQQSGQITEGSQQWRELEDTIRSTKENMAGLSNEYEELIDKLQNARFENLQKTFTEADDLAQHNLRMIQYEETRYQNRGELTNYGTLLSQDTDMQRERAANITQYLENLRAQQEEVKDNPQLFDKITSEIYKWEESLSQINNQIEKNTDLMKKNEEAIRKARQAVENVIDKEIRERIQKEKDMLAATVQVENSIIEAIKKRYTDEWNLQKKDIDKKKQALNEEKNLINERLNAKKEAIAQEEKYEELAEYKRQLALISADTTRTKDAAELRRQIQDLEKELSWETVQDEANFQIETIDNSIKAYDEYVSAREEDLNEYLSDKNNFMDEVQKVMGGDFKTYAEYMRNTETYKKSTAEERQQTEQSWLDLWQKMKGELNSYWEEVDETMRTRENFIAYMMGSDSYSQVASESGRQSLVAYWEDLYDNYTASLIDNADFDHTHEITDKIDELKDWVFNVNLMGFGDYDIQSNYSTYDYYRKHNVEEYTPDSDYKGVGKKYEEPTYTYAEPAQTVETKSSGTSNTPKSVPTVYYALGSGYIGSVKGWNNVPKNAMHASESYSQIQDYVKGTAPTTSKLGNWITSGFNSIISSVLPHNAEGGLVDYTGPTWVDGTPSHPESFLDATDTELLRNMLDAFTYVKTSPTITRLDQSNFGKGNVNVGDVNVNLYEAKLENDADYDVIAEKVGKAFTKQLQKDGFNLAGYAW